MTAPTVAGVRSVLVGAADVLEQAGWCQNQPRDLTGAVCAAEAVRIAADGDIVTMTDALLALERRLPPFRDVHSWQDWPERTKDEVLDFLRGTAALVTVSTLRGWPQRLYATPTAGEPSPPSAYATSFMPAALAGGAL